MSFDTKQYIIDLAKQLNLKNMDDARRARLKDLKKKKVATGDQAGWDPDADLPKLTDYTGGAPLNSADLVDLYKNLQMMLYNVSVDKELMKDKATTKFINEYYGPGKAIEPLEYEQVFSDTEANELGTYISTNLAKLSQLLDMSDQVKNLGKLAAAMTSTPPTYRESTKHIATLQQFFRRVAQYYNQDHREELPAGLPIFLQQSEPLDDTEKTDIATYINVNIAGLEISTGIPRASLITLKDALTSTPPTYHNNPATFRHLRQLFDYGVSDILPGGVPSCLKDVEKMYSLENYRPGRINLNTDKISEWTESITEVKAPTKDLVPPTPPVAGTVYFSESIEPMLSDIASKDKLREKLFSKDTSDFKDWFNDGLDKTNYKDGKNKLTPKFEDRKRFFKRAKEKIQQKYGDTLGKLEQKHKRHIYSTNARYVVEQLLKKKIDPTSGMEKLSSTLGAITGDLPTPVQEQTKTIKGWFDTLAGNDFFKDALRDGKQMRRLVQEIIKLGVKEEKKAEAKVALEMLSVMRYTMTTSSIRDKLKKEDFTIFSDSSLSFNKDGGGLVQTFTKATDKLLKTMAMGAFELGNLAKNAINTNGIKFKHGDGHLDKTITESVLYTNAEKKAMMEELFAFWDFVNSSQQSKDYNIFKSHQKVQGKADTATGRATKSVTTSGGVTYEIDNPTVQDEKFLEYLLRNNIGRNA